ncbi:hypothetical protein HOLleu_25570 [Holothuria leucospilota]|uniref:Uncharacterized protein n=1 Tax=Holothuria leucospilota TaxID=206669 RepID=A0A9Q1BT75_HOLLE|nr:hypothetical protein HOLleu_25570 [Holothuria leucospilota]
MVLSYNCPNRPKRDNLTKQERSALRQLQSNKDIIIKPADKGSAVVVMSLTDYIFEGERQLSNTSTYNRLTNDATNYHSQRVRQTVESSDLDSEIKDVLVPRHTSCSNLYFLPKTHKPNNPGRPIVSGCACPTTQISKFVDYFLRPLVQALPFSYSRHNILYKSHQPNQPKLLTIC